METAKFLKLSFQSVISSLRAYQRNKKELHSLKSSLWAPELDRRDEDEQYLSPWNSHRLTVEKDKQAILIQSNKRRYP